MNNSTIIEALKALRYVQAMTGESSKEMEKAIEELEKDLEVSEEVAPSNPTNEKILDEFMKMLKDELYNVEPKHKVRILSRTSDRFLKALQAKDEQARREMVGLVERIFRAIPSPFCVCSLGNKIKNFFNCCTLRVQADFHQRFSDLYEIEMDKLRGIPEGLKRSEMVRWKQSEEEKLTQLKK